LLTPRDPISELAIKAAARIMEARQPEDEKSLNQQIIDIIDMLAETSDVDAEELLDGLPDGTNITSVRSALARLAEQNKIRRTTRGRYGSIKAAPLQAELAS